MVVQKVGGFIRLGRGAGVRHDRAVCVSVHVVVRIGWLTRNVLHESTCFFGDPELNFEHPKLLP